MDDEDYEEQAKELAWEGLLEDASEAKTANDSEQKVYHFKQIIGHSFFARESVEWRAKMYFDLGLAYAGQSDWERSIEEITKAIDLNPKSDEIAQLYDARGDAYKALGKHEDALKNYELCLFV
jgi:tetratricopeptide (TPR) repeat protein